MLGTLDPSLNLVPIRSPARLPSCTGRHTIHSSCARYFANRTRLAKCVEVVGPDAKLASPADKVRRFGGVNTVGNNRLAIAKVKWRLSHVALKKEDAMYAAIRQGKAKAGMAEELVRRIKEGAIPIISDVPGFQAYYVVYAPDDTVTAISIFDNVAGAEESNRRGLAWIEVNLAPLLDGPATAVAGPVIVHTLA